MFQIASEFKLYLSIPWLFVNPIHQTFVQRSIGLQSNPIWSCSPRPQIYNLRLVPETLLCIGLFVLRIILLLMLISLLLGIVRVLVSSASCKKITCIVFVREKG